jgi:phage shock protein A
MGLLDRLLRRRTEAEAQDDPAADLERWFREQGERLARVRAAIAQIAAARVRLELAIHSVEGRRDPVVAEELPGLRAEHEDLAERERQLREEAARLEAEVHGVHARGERLRAAHAAAEARARARVAAAEVTRDLGELNLAAIRAQEAVDRSRSHAEALDEILGTRSLPEGSPPEGGAGA